MQRFLRAIAAQPWAIEPAKAQEILGYLEARWSGVISADVEVESAITKRRESEVRSAAGGVQVIPVHGAISNRASLMDGTSLGMGTSVERLESEIRAAYDDEAVKAIVLDMNTPGGSAAGTPELAAAIRSMRDEQRKPIVAQVNSLAASAGYWIASQADEIVATPSSNVGSIGVIAVHEEVSRMLDEQGVTETIISAGRYKSEGNPFEPLSEDGRAHLQATVDQYYTMFIDAVASGRGVGKRKVEADYGQGRTMIAADALAAGMIDRVGTMRETLGRLGAGASRPGRNQSSGRPRSLAAKRMELERLQNSPA